MPHIICFGRELPNVEYEYLHGQNCFALLVDGYFAAYFDAKTEPLEVYCKWLSHGRIDRAEYHSLYQLQGILQGYSMTDIIAPL